MDILVELIFWTVVITLCTGMINRVIDGARARATAPCDYYGHDWKVTTLPGDGGTSHWCIDCDETVGVPQGCLWVTEDEYL
jgi:hypothetical protein